MTAAGLRPQRIAPQPALTKVGQSYQKSEFLHGLGRSRPFAKPSADVR
jgi:hypothetical protein